MSGDMVRAWVDVLEEGLERFDFVSASDTGVAELADWLATHVRQMAKFQAAVRVAPAEEALDRACPTCQAWPRQACTSNGAGEKYVHVERVAPTKGTGQ